MQKIFSLRLLQKMTKYCVMRVCENINSWISISGDLAFSHQYWNCDFTFPQRFLGISYQRSHTLLLFSQTQSSKDLIIHPTFEIDALSLCIHMVQCYPSNQTFSHWQATIINELPNNIINNNIVACPKFIMTITMLFSYKQSNERGAGKEQMHLLCGPFQWP